MSVGGAGESLDKRKKQGLAEAVVLCNWAESASCRAFQGVSSSVSPSAQAMKPQPWACLLSPGNCTCMPLTAQGPWETHKTTDKCYMFSHTDSGRQKPSQSYFLEMSLQNNTSKGRQGCCDAPILKTNLCIDVYYYNLNYSQ